MIYILIFMKTVYWIQNFERRIPSVSVLDHPVHGLVLPDLVTNQPRPPKNSVDGLETMDWTVIV